MEQRIEGAIDSGLESLSSGLYFSCSRCCSCHKRTCANVIILLAAQLNIALGQLRLKSHCFIITSKKYCQKLLHAATYASKSFWQYSISRYYSYSRFCFISRFAVLMIPGPYRASAVVI